MPLDDLDRKILRHLQRDGRVSNVDLARAINLSTSATLERVRRLEQAGTIQGYSARLDPDAVQLGLLVFVQITLDTTNQELFERFTTAVKKMPQISECYMVAGGFDYLIKARVRDMSAYRTFLGSTLARLPGVRQTHTYAVMEEVKADPSLPV